ncbi:hypothetical protein [Sinorhizobium meliloti]|uniref:hypothetical protein n=1 Tax=Rhizobium meliloti TaxID=382 RepID=UPI0012953D4A|nr:hypothetical protein [Sinorhizobium meliloti]MQV09067.1 hypothetical protein [Sinorhizobium meliloti]
MIHSIGEQIPMAAINGFIDAVWTSGKTLADRGKPDPNTGTARIENASWSKGTLVDPAKLKGFKQDSRVRMETMIRWNLSTAAEDWSVETFRGLQDKCKRELNALANPWIVSDFVSIGSPLTHAEFLLAVDEKTLERAKRKRVLPRRPPMLEHDGKTGRLHVTYRAPEVRGEGDSHDVPAPRVPHHGAVFSYTRWTNIYSRPRLLLIGDIVSGPLRGVLGLSRLVSMAPLRYRGCGGAAK